MPGSKQVLVQAHAAGVNAGDLFSVRGSPWLVRFSVGFPKPMDCVPGWDVAGRIAAVGLILPNSGHGGMSYVFKAFALSMVSRRYGRPFLAVTNHADLNLLKEYCEAGKLKPVIEETYPLSETARAIAHLDRGHARGKIVIEMEPEN